MMCSYEKSRDGGVSPVVGVMLMLVVTIIIAAVVSAFGGGLAKTSDEAPTANLQIQIVNDGTWGGSTFDVIVLGVSDNIPTKDLRITTDWKAADGTTGGATITGLGNNTHYASNTYNSPLGFGPGVNRTRTSGSYYTDQWFGNYSLMAGTRMHNSAAGYAGAYGGYGVMNATAGNTLRYIYTPGTYNLGPGQGGVDAMMAILGTNWNALRPGDIVNVHILHVPSGKMIYDGKVTVEGG